MAQAAFPHVCAFPCRHCARWNVSTLQGEDLEHCLSTAHSTPKSVITTTWTLYNTKSASAWQGALTQRARILLQFSFFNNQPDALIIPILFCYKTLHVSGIFSAHHQELSTVHSALVRFMQVWWPLPSRVRMERVPSWLCLEEVIRNLHETYQWRMYSRKLLMMGREDARNIQQNKIGISASGWLFKKEIYYDAW
jgi:hypothetical protein